MDAQSWSLLFRQSKFEVRKNIIFTNIYLNKAYLDGTSSLDMKNLQWEKGQVPLQVWRSKFSWENWVICISKGVIMIKDRVLGLKGLKSLFSWKYIIATKYNVFSLDDDISHLYNNVHWRSLIMIHLFKTNINMKHLWLFYEGWGLYGFWTFGYGKDILHITKSFGLEKFLNWVLEFVNPRRLEVLDVKILGFMDKTLDMGLDNVFDERRNHSSCKKGMT